MKNKKFTIATADLNSGTEQVVDIELTLNNGTVLKPDQVLIDNGTGGTVGYLVLEDDNEKDVERDVLYPTYYDFVPLVADENYFDISTPKYLVLKKLAGTVSADLDIWCINYRPVK